MAELLWSQDKKSYGLNNCPFCGSVVLKMEKRRVDRETLKYFSAKIREMFPEIKRNIIGYYIHCENCGAQGPPCVGREGAAARWNKCIPLPDPLEEAMNKK